MKQIVPPLKLFLIIPILFFWGEGVLSQTDTDGCEIFTPDQFYLSDIGSNGANIYPATSESKNLYLIYCGPPVDVDEAMPHYGPMYMMMGPPVDVDEAMPHYGPFASFMLHPDTGMPHYIYMIPCVDVDEAMPHYGPFMVMCGPPVDVDEAMPHYGPFTAAKGPPVDVDEAMPHYGPLLSSNQLKPDCLILCPQIENFLETIWEIIKLQF